MDTKQIADDLALLVGDVRRLEDYMSQDYGQLWSFITQTDKVTRELSDKVVKLEGQRRFNDIVQAALTNKPSKKGKILVFGAGVVVGVFVWNAAVADKNNADRKVKEAIGERS
jgi:hypothetical protein